MAVTLDPTSGNNRAREGIAVSNPCAFAPIGHAKPMLASSRMTPEDLDILQAE
jgi:hypothetical protein